MRREQKEIIKEQKHKIQKLKKKCEKYKNIAMKGKDTESVASLFDRSKNNTKILSKNGSEKLKTRQ